MKDPKDVVCLVIDNGLFCELAIKLAQTYKKVYYYVPWECAFPRLNLARIGTGIDELELVDSIYGPHFDEIDLFCFPDIYFGWEQEHLIKMGKTVWGSRTGEALELNREGMKAILKELDMPVGKFWHVKGMQNLRDFLRDHENVYVKTDKFRGTFETFHSMTYDLVEPKLDEVEWSLGRFKDLIEFTVEEALDDRVEFGTDAWTIDGKFPSKLISGLEIKDCGFASVFTDYNKIPEPLTRFNERMKPVFEAYGYRGFFSSEIRIGKDMNPYMIDFCYSQDTEVLTQNGWKLFADTTPDDLFATHNMQTGEMEYQRASAYTEYHYEGKMVSISNRKKTIECLVTPNHDVVRTDRHKKITFNEKANALTDKGFIPRVGIYKCGDDSNFVLPYYKNKWDFFGQYGHYICEKNVHYPQVDIPLKTWAKFLGWYLSEGSTSGNYVTQISQQKHVEQCKNDLAEMPFEFSYDGKMFRASSVQLASYLKKFGTCNNKFIPTEIKNASSEVILVFLDAFRLGDGSHTEDSHYRYYTTSKQLADDLQELCLKAGLVANIAKKPSKGTEMKIGGKTYKRNYDKYILTVVENSDFWFETGKLKSNYINEVDYSGTVHCVTVLNGTLYVRRNGKSFISGNCARAPSPPNELYQEQYKNMAECIWAGANGQILDPEPVAKFGAEIMLHSSFADKNWQPLRFPEEIRQFVKLRNIYKDDRGYFVVPQATGLPEIGAVVGLGDTLEAAFDHAIENAELVEGYYLEAKTGAIEKVKEQIEKMDKLGLSVFNES